jgi:transposase-like protein
LNWVFPREGQGVNVLKPNKKATIVTLLERGTPHREIARITGIDRKTVGGYRDRWLAEQANSPGVATGSEAAAASLTT